MLPKKLSPGVDYSTKSTREERAAAVAGTKTFSEIAELVLLNELASGEPLQSEKGLDLAIQTFVEEGKTPPRPNPAGVKRWLETSLSDPKSRAYARYAKFARA